MNKSFDPIPVPAEVIIDVMSEPIAARVTTMYQGKDNNSGRLRFTVTHRHLGNLGPLELKPVARDCFWPIWHTFFTPPVEDAIAYAARVRKSQEIAGRYPEVWQRYLAGTTDPYEAAIACAENIGRIRDLINRAGNEDIRADESFVNPEVEQYLTYLETLPLAERALAVFTDHRLVDLPRRVQEFIRHTPPKSIDGRNVELFGEMWKSGDSDMQIARDLEADVKKAQDDVDIRKDQYIILIDQEIRKELRRRGSMIDEDRTERTQPTDNKVVPAWERIKDRPWREREALRLRWAGKTPGEIANVFTVGNKPSVKTVRHWLSKLYKRDPSLLPSDYKGHN